MPIIQVSYQASASTYEKLLTGEYNRFGSVVRDSKQIVEHLKEIKLPDQDDVSKGLAAAKTFMKNNKNILIGLGIITAGVGIGVGLYNVVKNNKRKKDFETEMPKSIVDFNNSICDFLDEIGKGNLKMDTLTRLSSDLDNIKLDNDSGKVSIDFSTGQLSTLNDLISDYTSKLAAANSFEYKGHQLLKSASTNDKIIQLKHCLNVQQQILEKAS